MEPAGTAEKADVQAKAQANTAEPSSSHVKEDSGDSAETKGSSGTASTAITGDTLVATQSSAVTQPLTKTQLLVEAQAHSPIVDNEPKSLRMKLRRVFSRKKLN